MAAAVSWKMLAKLLAGVVVSFLFAVFAMPPLFSLYCEVTGVGGKTGSPNTVTETGVDESRTVRVQFVTINNGDMTWEFAPAVYQISVHPGQLARASFRARNATGRGMVGRAVSSVSPGSAARYVHEAECFCARRQVLAPGEIKDLPLTFVVDRDLPRTVRTITIAYTLFDVTARSRDLLAELN